MSFYVVFGQEKFQGDLVGERLAMAFSLRPVTPSARLRNPRRRHLMPLPEHQDEHNRGAGPHRGAKQSGYGLEFGAEASNTAVRQRTSPADHPRGQIARVWAAPVQAAISLSPKKDDHASDERAAHVCAGPFKVFPLSKELFAPIPLTCVHPLIHQASLGA